MSVVYLKPVVTKDPEEFERCKCSLDSKILMYYEEEKNQDIIEERNNVKIDNFSLDITLGNSWNQNYSYHDMALYEINGGEIKISPRTSVAVRIREYIKVPNNRFGIVLSTGSLFLQAGVQSAIAKIEPGYSGTLILRLTNTSNKEARIKKGAKIASVIFLSTNDTPKYIEAENSRRVNELKKTKCQKFLFWVNNLPWFNIITILIAAGSLIKQFL